MKIRDLDPNKLITGTRVKHPKTGKPVIIKGAWAKGVWFAEEGSTKLNPHFIDSVEEIMDLELFDQ